MRAAAGLLLLLIGLCGSQAEVEGRIKRSDVLTEVTALKVILMETKLKQQILQDQVNKMKEELNRENTKVAFYAALSNSGIIGPFQDRLTLKYSKVFTNVGNAYNNLTGIFTAPVEGVYSFQFTAFGYSSCSIRLHVYKNYEKIMNNWKHNSSGDATYFTNSLILELKKGDTISFQIPAGACLYDDINNYSTITGFLL